MAFGGDPDSEVLSVHSMFDASGNIVEEIRIDEEDQVEKHTFAYDGTGKLVRHELIIESDGVSESFEYARDEKGRITAETKFYGEDEGESVVYVYEAHDQPVMIERFDSDSELESIEKISYNDRNLLIEHKRFKPENELLETTNITYNEKDLPVEKVVMDNAGHVTSTTFLEYNDKGEPVRITEKNNQGKVISDVTSVYDDRGNVVERKVRDFHSRTLRFVFDERNNCIEETVYDENGNLTMKSNYEFDENNQLTTESGYFLDMNRGSQLANTQSHYEYEYY